MKTIHVVAAVITDKGQVLATQRGYGEFRGWWEFPGGKVEKGETKPEALIREIKEELGASIEVVRELVKVEYQYDSFYLKMDCFLCHLTTAYTLLEHEDARWLGLQDLDTVDWLPADIKVIEAIKKEFVE